MDSIFEEDADEVGGEIEAYCPSPRCKADTTHTIISMYEDEVRRVQCVVCGEVHAFRKPRGDAPEEVIRRIADYRGDEKQPNYARYTVEKAQLQLQRGGVKFDSSDRNIAPTTEPSHEP